LNCNINDKIVGCFSNLGMTNLFMISQAVEWLGVKTELMANPITMQLAQGIARPSLSVVLGIKLFCRGV
jgi:hypothetical protein